MSLDKPDKGIVDEYSFYRKKIPSITFIVDRDVVSPVLFRNSETDRAEVTEVRDNFHAQVNGEKFVSKERLTGLRLLRELDDRFDGSDVEWDKDNQSGLISSSYCYNSDMNFIESLNLDLLAYGGAGTKDDNFSMKSHTVEGYCYSIQEYDFTNSKEVRNAIKETGTMNSGATDQSSSLFEFSPIKPPNNFVHFVTLDSPSYAMVVYVLHNILNTSSYGARSSRHGKNLNNSILGVIESTSKVDLSTRELLRDYPVVEDDLEKGVKKYVDDFKRHHWDVSFDDYPDWFEEAREMASRRVDSDKEMYDIFKDLTDEVIEKVI
jgi:CRISPR-associated protein Csc2